MIFKNLTRLLRNCGGIKISDHDRLDRYFGYKSFIFFRISC